MLREVLSEADDIVPGSGVITQLLLTEDPQHAQGTLLRAAMEKRAVELVNAAKGDASGGSEKRQKPRGKLEKGKRRPGPVLIEDFRVLERLQLCTGDLGLLDELLLRLTLASQ